MKTLAPKARPFAGYADIPKTYRELCQLYLPRPIHDDAEDAEATAMMNALAVFTRLNSEQQDYLDVLTDFVDEFDKGRKVRWPKVNGLDMLKHLMPETWNERGGPLAPFGRQPQPGRNDPARRTQADAQSGPHAPGLFRFTLFWDRIILIIGGAAGGCYQDN